MKNKILKLGTFIILFGVLVFPTIYVKADTTTEPYDNYVEDNTVSCGSGLITEIPTTLPKAIHIIYIIIQIAVPIVLVILGMIDLIKGLTAQKEEEIKKGQQIFIKRLIAAGIVFFVFSIVRLVVSLVGDNYKTNIIDCADCFISNKCEENPTNIIQDNYGYENFNLNIDI